MAFLVYLERTLKSKHLVAFTFVFFIVRPQLLGHGIYNVLQLTDSVGNTQQVAEESRRRLPTITPDSFKKTDFLFFHFNPLHCKFQSLYNSNALWDVSNASIG